MMPPPMPQFSPLQNHVPMIQLSSLADIVALGGFNPNKYLTPQPMQMPFYQNYGQMPPHMMPPHMQYGNPQPFMGQPQKQGPKKDSPKTEKREGKKPKGEKKYVSKQVGSPQKKETSN
jgi:hypothetical protein